MGSTIDVKLKLENLILGKHRWTYIYESTKYVLEKIGQRVCGGKIGCFLLAWSPCTQSEGLINSKVT